MRTLIIAEAGVNHNGDSDIAHRLIDVAAEAGADVIKFQTFSADRLVTAHAAQARYQRDCRNASETQQAMLRRLELTHAMHEELIVHCNERGIEFLSTGFDEESVDLLLDLGVKRLKIPSGEITNLPYLRHVGATGRPLILSTGMSTLTEIEAALAALSQSGSTRANITVLHCTTAYPTPMSDVNLRAMLTMRDSLSMDVGYSDHTIGIEVSIAAVSLGATVIEKHFTLDRKLPGPDHKASATPQELGALVAAVRNIELALGRSVKEPTQSEIENVNVVRKSVVARRPIEAGESFNESNVAVKRPGGGISPMRWDEVLMSRASRDFKTDEPIEL